jgi:homoserine dehydrogenase
LRLQVSDNSGVLASITKCFSDAGVSIARLIQQERNSSADITLTTHLTKEANMNKAISAMQELDNILLSPARLIRIEQS